MHRSNIRVMKMDRNDRSILMRALYADFCANREVGLPYGHLAALIAKLHLVPRSQNSAQGFGIGVCSLVDDVK